MLSERLLGAFDDQIELEFYSAHAYLSIAAYFEDLNLPGFVNWSKIQFDEEVSHAMKLFDFVHDRGNRVTLHGIDKPPADWASPIDAMQQALQHERKVTAAIHDLYEASVEGNDRAAQVLLQWFIEEQVEEEKAVEEIVDHLRIVGGDGTGLIVIDARLGERTPEEDSAD
ncbi:MAG: ferritin [Chloroflexi bacterium]|nr:ferritin [Chloroflexota bacterium]